MDKKCCPPDLVRTIEDNLARNKDRIIGRYFPANGEPVKLIGSFWLLHRVKSMAAGMTKRGWCGQSIVLLFDNGFDLLIAFLACLFSGAVAVPVFYPKGQDAEERNLRIIKDCEAVAILSSLKIKELLSGSYSKSTDLCWFVVEDLYFEIAQEGFTADENDTVYMQYGANSAIDVNGAQITYANLSAEIQMMTRRMDLSSEDIGCCWAPLYFDLGLVMTVMTMLYINGSFIFFEPNDFISNPEKWLELISRYKVTFSSSPNSGYGLAADRIDPASIKDLDLSSWKIALNAGEFVHKSTLDRFYAKFSAYGFSYESFLPCYGLTEATGFVTSTARGEKPSFVASSDVSMPEGCDYVFSGEGEITSCGKWDDLESVVIVDPKTLEKIPITKNTDKIRAGEIWISGPHVIQGYIGKEKSSSGKFRASLSGCEGSYLRTGDLGFVHDGDLFIVGRMKRLCILFGQNYCPEDFEKVACENLGLKIDHVAAYSLEQSDREQLVLIAEDESNSLNANSADRLLKVCAKELRVQPRKILFFKKDSLPRTLSGQIDISEAKSKISQSIILPFLLKDLSGGEKRIRKGVFFLDKDWNEETAKQKLKQWFLSEIKSWLLISEIEEDGILNEFDSISLVKFNHHLESVIGRRIPVSLFLGENVDNAVGELYSLCKKTKAIESGHEAQKNERHPELSVGEEALWTIYKMSPDNSAYNVPLGLKISDPYFDTQRFKISIEKLSQCHPILRTIIKEIHGIPFPSVNDAPLYGWKVLDQGSEEKDFRSDFESAAIEPFNLAQGPVFKVIIAALSDGSHLVGFVFHHIITDLWSLNVFFRDLFSLYQGEKIEQGPCYADFVVWQKDYLASDAGTQDRNFWMENLGGQLPILDLPCDKNHPSVQSYQGETFNLSLDTKTSSLLERIAGQKNLSMYQTLMGLYQSFLYRITGQTEVIVGVPYALRPGKEFDSLMGYCINSLPVRATVDGQSDVWHWIIESKEKSQDAIKHGNYPFALMVQGLHNKHDFSRAAVFQTMFVYQKAQFEGSDELTAAIMGYGGLKFSMSSVNLETLDLKTHSSQFELTVMASKIQDRLFFQFKYNSDLFEASTIKRLAGCFSNFIENIIHDDSMVIDQVPLLTAEEKTTLIKNWNARRKDFGSNELFHQKFEYWASKTPEALAVKCAEVELTYYECNKRANRIAGYLLSKGIGSEKTVGIFLDRSVDQIVAILAVHKAGGAFVPVDGKTPVFRVEQMLNISGCSVLITDQFRKDSIFMDNISILALDSDSDCFIFEDEKDRPCLQNRDSLAYVLFTSGSTGVPKGVMVEHKQVDNYVQNMLELFGLPSGSSFGLVPTISADMSLSTILPALMSGSSLHVFTEMMISDPEMFVQYLAKNPLDLIKMVPSHFDSLLISSRFEEKFFVKILILAGEAFPMGLAERIMSLDKGIRLMNHYGPTETAVSVLGHEVDVEYPYYQSHTVPLGKPFSNISIYILDKQKNPVPIGVPGEVYIGGVCVSRGYINNPKQTLDRFLPDPFSEEGNTRMYRTGDLAKYLPDGSVQFLSRIDSQVKIRGYRIELEEIEASLLEFIGVKNAVVLPVMEEDELSGEKRQLDKLVAYIVSSKDEEFTGNDLKIFLQSRLPNYMIPTYYAFLDEFPVLANGKIDRKVLSQSLHSLDTIQKDYVAPRDRLEEVMCEYWKNELKLESVGVADNFFELGGNSLLATRIIGFLQDLFQTDQPLIVSFFENPTVEGMAQAIRNCSLDVSVDEIAEVLFSVINMDEDEVDRLLVE